MQLNDEDIQEFIRIWKEEFGEEISPAYARERASQILEMFWLIAEEKARQMAESDSPKEEPKA